MTKYKPNLTRIRIRLRTYLKNIKSLPSDALEVLLDECINRIRAKLELGEILDENEEHAAIKEQQSYILSRINEAGYAKSKAGKDMTICWKCRHALPKIVRAHYIRGCEWSIKHQPVPGWDAEKKIVEDRLSYKVHKCPKFEKGRL